MPEITIYSTSRCPYCVAAVNLCVEKGFKYKEIDLTDDFDGLVKIKEQTGMQTVPQIFIDQEFIGGFSELRGLNETGQLDKKMAKK